MSNNWRISIFSRIKVGSYLANGVRTCGRKKNFSFVSHRSMGRLDLTPGRPFSFLAASSPIEGRNKKSKVVAFPPQSSKCRVSPPVGFFLRGEK
jgi:hypothetical protein